MLGPLLRYAGTESATFWVEVSAPCEVEILGHRSSTFAVEGHHYALLLVGDLIPGTVTPYEVRLDGVPAWPPADGRPQLVVHTRDNERSLRAVFGSCRRGDPERGGVERPSATWEPVRRPTFENAISEVMLDGATARVVVRRSPRDGEDPERLVAEAAVPLAGGSRS